MVHVRVFSRRLIVLVALLALLWGGREHQHAGETLSHGTFLFPPDHPAHAPFVPQPERPCVACALAVLSVPTAVPVFLVPPLVRPGFEVCAEGPALAPDTPELPGRSPPPSPA
jgi:hypothetical protein